MLIKLTNYVPADRCGVWLVRVIHTYSKLKLSASVSAFMKCSVRSTKPNNWVSRKKKKKSLYIRSSHTNQYLSGFSYFCKSNSGMLLKKRLTPLGSKVTGPIDNRVRRKRARASFIKVI